MLADQLAAYRNRPDIVVLGIPRGGVIVAAQVARALGAPLDVLITRKIGAPQNPELAVGAVASDGTVYLDDMLLHELHVPPSFVDRERARQVAEISRRATMYRQGRLPLDVEGRTAIVCDDGVATGATTLVALRALRQRKPARLILAVPVGPEQTLERLGRECDELVVLEIPDPFWAVGLFYEHFDQVSDEQVVEALRN